MKRHWKQDEGDEEKGATEPIGDNHSAHDARDDSAQTRRENDYLFYQYLPFVIRPGSIYWGGRDFD